ncbi:beta-N-acetylhexosaminidase [Arachidicoccus sp.]|uniref:beta-N-acetylhexosaminidase n=1 Tax=Arachidicoccus sp. TaxID=1872624 RepID=UPI003D218CE9
MKSKYIFCLLFLFVAGPIFAQKAYPIIPMPEQSIQKEGLFILNSQTSVYTECKDFKPLVKFLDNELKQYKNISVIKHRRNKHNAIVFKKVQMQTADPEAYSLVIEQNCIYINAGSSQGIFYGIMSLTQLLREAPVQRHSVFVNCGEIYDRPQFKWRGIMLDESRHFFGKKTVERLLDWMAYYKLNIFHWHLTDEPAWRLQIKQYPKLTTIGAIGNKYDSTALAKFYTQKEIKEIVAYAKARFITVVPEIDMPGHATAANRAYPEYSGGGEGKYANFTFNPGKESTYQYLTNILRETAGLFSAKMIHVGGDEVSFGSENWKRDTGIQSLMKRESLTNLKMVEAYFIQRMADSARQFDREVLAWDEAADDSLPKDSTIIFWWRQDQPQQLDKALNKGYKVVLCPRIPLYFDFVQDKSHRKGRTWNGGFSSLEKVYAFSALKYVKNKRQLQQILGIQANLWTETVVTQKRLDFMLFPRMAALAEAAWSQSSAKNYQDFLFRLQKEFPLYKQANIYYYNPLNPAKTPEITQ